MATVFYAIGRSAARHRIMVFAGWVAALGIVAVLAVTGGGKTVDDFAVPGTQSAQVAGLLKARLPSLAGAQTQVVFAAPTGHSLHEQTVAVQKALANLRRVPQVTAVSDPLLPQSGSISRYGRYALASVQYSVPSTQIKNATLNDLGPAVAPARDAGVQTQFTGDVYPGSADNGSDAPELIGLIVAFVILLLTLGSALDGMLPIVTALCGVVLGAFLIKALSATIDVSSIVAPLTAMLGLATGIDYSLFICSRHRANVLAGMAVEQSIATAVATAGSAVAFAASMVILALCGLTVAGIPFVTVMVLCAAAGVLISLLAAITLLPALLSVVGMRIIHFSIRRERASAPRAASHPTESAGGTWGRFVIRHRIPALACGLAVLVAVAWPIHSLRLGLPSADSQPTSSTGHKAYALISRGLGAGANAPLSVVADLNGSTHPHAIKQIRLRLASEPGVAHAQIGIVKNHIAVIQVTPTAGPDAKQTTNLVNRIRRQSAVIRTQTGVRVLVGGTTAANIDTSSKLGSALPGFLAIVIALATILLTAAFRTVIVPLKSVVGFLLSSAAGLGAEVAVFQWGWAHKLLHVTPSATSSYVPIILLAIVFGLSGDYEVFLVSRIREAFTRSGDAQDAIQAGLGASLRVVSAAALVMGFVFAAFLILPDVTVKAIGLGLAVAVLLDAFVVRLTLVPAVMSLIGGRFWDKPRWLIRHLPDLDIEGQRLTPAIQPARHVHVASAPAPSRSL